MREVASIPNCIQNFGVPGPIKAQEIIDLLDEGAIVVYREKYGFIRLITGYNRPKQRFFFIEAPVRYAFSDWETYLHIGRLGFTTWHVKDFSEIEHFSASIKPVPQVWRWFLRTFKGIA
jgi:hypothetical protein